jgi:fructokinase
MPPGPLTKEQIVDTVGAGDAFAAMLAHCLINGIDTRTTLRRCTQLAEFVCTVPGAVPDDGEIYQSLLESPS